MYKSLIFIMIIMFAEIHAQSWQIAGNMPNPVQGAGAVVINSKIYIIGGYNSQSNSNVDLIQEYDPQTDTWSVAGHTNSTRYGLNAFTYNDSVAYIGGINSGNSNASSLEFWNPGINAYVRDNNSNFNRKFAAGVIAGNNMYLFGGNSSLLNFNYWIKYDISAKSVVDSSGYNFLSTPFTDQMAVYGNNDIIYVFGGLYSSVGGNSFLTNDINSLNITTNSFTTINRKLSSPKANGKSVYFGNNKIYIIGGFNEQKTLSSVEIFNTSNNQISAGPSLNVERKELMAVKFGNSIYVFGGSDKNDQTVQSFEKLDIVTDVENERANVPAEYKLYQNYPNPFNPATVISYSIPEQSFVTLRIYNLLGIEVATLVNEVKSAGIYSINCSMGKKIESGVYFYRLQAGNFAQTNKMILLK